MGEMITLYGDNSFADLDKKQAEIYDRYLKGEISKEEGLRLCMEITKERNRQMDERIAAIKADAEEMTNE